MQFAPSWAWKTFKSHAATTLILFLFSLCSFGLKTTDPVCDFRERVGAVLAKASWYAWAQVHLKSDLFTPCPCTTYGPSPFLEVQTQKLELVGYVKPVNYLASTENIIAVLLSGHCLFKTIINTAITWKYVQFILLSMWLESTGKILVGGSNFWATRIQVFSRSKYIRDAVTEPPALNDIIMLWHQPTASLCFLIIVSK